MTETPAQGTRVTDEMILAYVEAADGYGVNKGSYLWAATRRGLEAALALHSPAEPAQGVQLYACRHCRGSLADHAADCPTLRSPAEGEVARLRIDNARLRDELFYSRKQVERMKKLTADLWQFFAKNDDQPLNEMIALRDRVSDALSSTERGDGS